MLISEKALLSLQTFNGLMGRSVDPVISKQAGKWEPPDPAGERTGRKRMLWRRETAEGYEYSPTKPEGVEGVEKPAEKKEKPKLLQELEALIDDLKNNRVSMDQAKQSSDKVMSNLGEQFREVKKKDLSSEDRKKLERISTASMSFAEARQKAVKKDDKRSMTEAIGTLQDIAQELGGVLENVKKREEEGTEGEKPKEESEEKPYGEEKPEELGFVYEKAALSTAPWEGKIKEIEKSITSKSKSRELASKGSRSVVFFEKAEDGTKSVFKPDGLHPPIGLMRQNILNEKVGAGHRESAAFLIDRALGFGIVPPTFMKKGEVPRSEKREAVRNIMSHPEFVQSKKKGEITPDIISQFARTDDDSAEGAVQQFVEGAADAADIGSRIGLSGRYDISEKFKMNMQKMAVFDYLTGATDRHYGNIMVDSDDNVYAIDNGLSFTKVLKDAPEEILAFGSAAYSLVREKTGGKLDKRITDQLRKVDYRHLRNAMKAHGLDSESKGMMARLGKVLETGELPKVDNWIEVFEERQRLPQKKRIGQESTIPMKSLCPEVDALLLKEKETKKRIVDIWSGPPGNRKVIATFVFDGRKVSCVKGEDTLIASSLARNGIRGLFGKRYKPEDGEKFIRNLPWGLCGSMVQAIPRGK